MEDLNSNKTDRCTLWIKTSHCLEKYKYITGPAPNLVPHLNYFLVWVVGSLSAYCNPNKPGMWPYPFPALEDKPKNWQSMPADLGLPCMTSKAIMVFLIRMRSFFWRMQLSVANSWKTSVRKWTWVHFLHFLPYLMWNNIQNGFFFSTFIK